MSGCDGDLRVWAWCAHGVVWVDDVRPASGAEKEGVDFVGQVPLPFPAFVDSVCYGASVLCVHARGARGL